MKIRRSRLIFFCILLTGLALQGCNLNTDGAVEPVGIAPLEAVVSTPTLSIPEGGTYKEPVFYVTASCPRWGEYVFDLRYSPADLNIISAGSSAMETGSPCSPARDGATRCTSIGAPYYLTGEGLSFGITYDYGAGRQYYDMEINNPACPPYVPAAVELVSVTCLPGNQVGFLIDPGPVVYWGAPHRSACLGNEVCAGVGSLSYGAELASTDPLHYEYIYFTGPAPTSPFPPMRFYYRFRGSPEAADTFVVVFEDFYTRYQAACPASLPPPQPTATAESPEEQPAVCSDYTSPDPCKLGGCSWDDVKNVCHP